MRRLPHVAFVITALHDVSGGAERVLVDVANGLHRRGYPVTVMTYQDQNGPSFYSLDYGIARLDGRQRHGRRGSGSPFNALSPMTVRNRAAAVAVWLSRYGPKVWRFRKLLRLARPDVAVGFLPSSFPYLSLAAIGTGVPVVASLHNVPDRDLGGDPDRWDRNPVDIALRLRALRTSAANSVLLESFVEQLPAEARARTFVIPNLVHPMPGPPADVRTDPFDNVVLAVGRLSGAKDHETLLRAWATIESDHPTWRLRIIGDGPLYGPLVESIEELRLTRATIDPPTADIASVYRASKLLVMPSLHEGFGLVTAEAMAAGLPVIGFSDCEGTNEIVIDGTNGVLVEPGSDRSGALASAIAALIDDESERVRLAAAGPASAERFAPDSVIDGWERLLDAVVAGEVVR